MRFRRARASGRPISTAEKLDCNSAKSRPPSPTSTRRSASRPKNRISTPYARAPKACCARYDVHHALTGILRFLRTRGRRRPSRNPALAEYGAPGSQGKTAKEIDEAPNKEHGYLKVTEVHTPSLTVYLPPADKATGTAVIIASGGGHRFLNFDQEGTYVAEYLNSIGVAGLVLKYRLAREPGSTSKIEEHALADAQRAIRMVRGARWRRRRQPRAHRHHGLLRRRRSCRAGRHPFRCRQRHCFRARSIALSSRPDFVALIYPGIRAEQYTIPKEMPVIFMLCADNDAGPSAALAGLYPMLKAAGVPTEVHVYAAGGHGFGLNPNTKNPAVVASTWHLRLGDWLNGLYKP